MSLLGQTGALRNPPLWCVVMSVCLTAVASAQEAKREPERSDTVAAATTPPRTKQEQRDSFLWGTFGPPAFLGAALSSAYQQWRVTPSEWGQSKDSLGKRFAAEFIESTITDSTKYTMARFFDEDPSFRPCACTGLMRRVTHAALGPITAVKPDGRTVFSGSRVIGVTTGKAVSTAWYPNDHGLNGVARHVAVDLGSQVGVNLLREFFFHRKGPPSQRDGR